MLLKERYNILTEMHVGNYMHWKQILKAMFWHVLQRILQIILKNYKANSPKINMFLNTNQL